MTAPSCNTDAELFSRAQAGDREARDAIVIANLPLARSLVARLVRDPKQRADYHADAAIGLLRAIDLYDPARAAFSTYACRWIAHCVVRARQRDRRAVSVPYQAPRDETRAALARKARRPVPLDVPLGDGTITLADVIAIDAPLPDELVESAQRTREVEALLRPLDQRSRAVLRRRARGETLASIGASMRLSRERVRQLEAAAFRTLRAAAGTNIQPRHGREGEA